MKQLLTFISIFILLSNKGMSQTFLNGSFENCSANNCMLNIDNPTFNSYFTYVRGIGVLQKLDILYNPCSGIVQAQEGNYFISLENYVPGAGVSAISLTLSDSIISGNRFTFSFYYTKVNAFEASAVEIGLSNDSSTFGNLVFTVPPPDTNIWVKCHVSFIAPLTGKYLTTRVVYIAPPPIVWVLIDNFGFDTIDVSVNEWQPSKSELGVFPNPSKEIFYMQFNHASEWIESFFVKNVLGIEVCYSKNNINQINLSEHPSGIYFLQVLTTGGRMYSVKLVKE